MSLSVETIYRYMKAPSRFALTAHSQVTSTSTLLREAAENGAAEGTVILADGQTAGRGRQGHSFWSPNGTGLYFSVLLRPQGQAVSALPLTAAAAVAAARAVETVSGREADIQWVNDIYCDGKKVCGILTEGRLEPQSGTLDYAIVGVGINVAAPADGFPEEIRDRAGAVFAHAEDGVRERMAAVFLEELWDSYAIMERQPFYEEYRHRCLRLGRSVCVLRGGDSLPAQVLDVTDELALRVQFDDGRVEELTSGEVSIRPLSANAGQ
ncbi:MAG: biotin--[acetyl-CoA-carboxylase] ligase [Clostridia bacterium]|nr:biotin--[acetyl-CoA-carboxylase] ligase [Clostridia bacterium]